MGKKNRSNAKTEKPKKSFQDQLKIGDLVKELLSKSSQVGPMNKSEEWENYLGIYDILQQLIALQKSPPPSAGTAGRAERLACLHTWLLENGGIVHGLTPAVYAGLGCGLTCVRPLAEGEPVIEVPRALMMTLETARASRLGGLLATDKLTQALPQLGLTLHLLEQSLTEDSRWAPYVASLPDTYDTVLYFTPDEIQLLKGSPCFEEAVKQCRNIARQYAYYHGFLHHCPEARTLALRDNFTYERYR
ncbi:actin-histidine N-methyltransferase-like [Pollicipes pollicipes]|uniref:actin-histidine N-methyltransferase-like n=1 Tax=Pollicipes pollicipes TaxID=41117 RepID=UPI0018854CE3|nr:actin-histidine N-methyltransferase-like [Pollicipes pollicipes]